MKKVIVVFSLILISCADSKNMLKEQLLNNSLTTLDSLLIDVNFNYEGVTKALDDVELNLDNSEDMSFDNDLWQTQATFKSNSDSSIVFINAKEKSKNGFKRE